MGHISPIAIKESAVCISIVITAFRTFFQEVLSVTFSSGQGSFFFW